MPHNADDKRALFQRVVDDIIDQIRTEKLKPGDVLPTSRRMAEIYDVASMTAQRALRELQTLGLTYGIVGKGTFVHPEALEKVAILDGQPVQTAEGITISAELAHHLQYRDLLAAKAAEWLDNLGDKPKAAQLQAELSLISAIVEGQRRELKDEIEKYQAELVAKAGPPPATPAQQASDDESPKPARRHNPRK
jgi:DNA-binding transcriptional regulator YhcF (GntR family)